MVGENVVGMWFGGRWFSRNWNQILEEAEKLVNYSGSLSLRVLLSDDVADVALTARKLIGTKHPLLSTARDLLYNGNNSIQTRGLIILLVGRVGNGEAQANGGGVSAEQRSLAEVSEVIYTANLIHRGVLNMEEMDSESFKTLNMGNKMAVLGGDYLLANASAALAKLGNIQVTNSMARAIADMSEAEFIGSPDPSGCYKIRNLKDWERKIYLSSGSLLARSCSSSLELTGANEEMKRNGFDFGSHISYAYAFSQHLQHQVEGCPSNRPSDVFCVVPDFDVSSDEVKRRIGHYSDLALGNLSAFPDCQALSSLFRITTAVRELSL